HRVTMQRRLAAWGTRAPAPPAEPARVGFATIDAAAIASHGVALPGGVALGRALALLSPCERAASPLFFDLETTGLSLDAPAFVIGLLGFDDRGAPWLHQLRLDARADEGAMWRELHAVLSIHAGHSRLV